MKDGADVNHVQLAPIGVDTDEEIGEVARAVDSMKGQSLRLAGEQAHLRQQVNVMFETLARRNKTLVEQQLSLIDSLEYQEKDPARLQSLFSLDHLATRMRRTGESLLVLAAPAPELATPRHRSRTYCAVRSPRSRTTSGSTSGAPRTDISSGMPSKTSCT